jgi:hypothetical protein
MVLLHLPAYSMPNGFIAMIFSEYIYMKTGGGDVYQTYFTRPHALVVSVSLGLWFCSHKKMHPLTQLICVKGCVSNAIFDISGFVDN